MVTPLDIKLVIFDWAGTTVDFGCCAPVDAFLRAFAQYGITVTSAEARGPMGLDKRDHFRELLESPNIAEMWQSQHGRPWNEADLDALFAAFIPLLAETVVDFSQLVPGMLECQAALRSREMLIGTTTGYSRLIADRLLPGANAAGYRPDFTVCADEVAQARPAPWMIFRNMEALGVYPPACVVKVGDTVPDIGEGRSAGCWSIGVTETGSEVGCTFDEFQGLSETEKTQRLETARAKLADAGAHAVIRSVAELPECLERIADCMKRGERP